MFARADAQSCLIRSQRSVLAELELQAVRYNSPLETNHLQSETGSIYTFERRVGGWRTGIHDGAVILSPSAAPAGTRVKLDELTSFLGDWSVATLRIVGPGYPVTPEELCQLDEAKRDTPNLWHVQEVMALEDTYDGFLRRLGKHTRRNIRQCRKWAEASALTFQYSPSACVLDHGDLFGLAKQNIPSRQSPSRLLKTIQSVAMRPRPFCASLCRTDGKPISVAGGFVEGDLALMAYQLNQRSFSALNPSLILRAFLVEQLIERGTRYLAFVGGCSGALFHQCATVAVEELLLVRNTISGRIKYFSAATLAAPRNRLARLGPRFMGLLISTLAPLLPNC